MISVVIPCLNADSRLGACLDALVPAAVGGIIKDVIVVDGGSTDKTAAIAYGFGATVLSAAPGRGGQLQAGADAARGEWLLFLHADTVLEPGWGEEVETFTAGDKSRAGVFTLSFNAKGIAPQIVAGAAMLRTKLFKRPYGDQGLLISRQLYDKIGGYDSIPLMEDVDIVRRLVGKEGRSAIHVFSSKAVTSAERYERDGYFARVSKNTITLTRYHLGAAPEKLTKHYQK